MSPHQSALIACLIDGLSGKQTAAAMGWGLWKTHSRLAGMYRAMGARNAAHAVALALTTGEPL